MHIGKTPLDTVVVEGEPFVVDAHRRELGLLFLQVEEELALRLRGAHAGHDYLGAHSGLL